MSQENIDNNSGETAIQAVTSPAEESFAEMLDKSGSFERLTPGQKVRARIVKVSSDLVYIDLGGKSEGTIDLREFTNENGEYSVREGDEIDAYYVTVQDGVRRLTTFIRGYSAASLAALRDSFNAGVPVTGEVKRAIKGGFEVFVGTVRCFCPLSQIDLQGGREGGLYAGNSFSFKILEFDDEDMNVVLSRRALLEQERLEKIEELKKTLSIGMDVTGTVKSVHPFGAFVSIGAIEGLIPASEMAWHRIGKPSDVLSPGQEVTSRIIAIDWEKNKVTMSLKATQPDPWASVADKYPVDSKVNGTVVRLTPFGAFVNLEQGIDGLIHISNFGTGRRIKHPKEVVDVGQWVEAYVLGVDREAKKISLSLQPKVKVEKVALPTVGQIVDGVVEKVLPFGVFLKLSSGLTGLIPNPEMGTPFGSDHKRMFPAGMEMQAMVVDVEAETRKIRLSRKAIMEKAVQDEYDQYRESVTRSEASSGGFGSLGEALRAKLEERKAQGSAS